MPIRHFGPRRCVRAEREQLAALRFGRIGVVPLGATLGVPEYPCRFRWQKNSVAFWDDCAVQHYAASDYEPQRRAMERVTIVGEAPV